ncbi:MAG TPA: hypothetical protein VFQ85_06200 [Mycobacteriales bacterium]|jgi:hypothetical protein|nr:hypothetical protein [Mycobacteriales bacterium]
MQFRYLESTDPKSPNCLKTRSQNPDANEQAIVTDSTHCMLVGPAKWTIRHVLDADVDVKESKAGRIVIKVLPMSQPDLDAVRKLADDADGKDIAVLFQGRLYGPMPAGELTRDREIRVTTDLAEPLARYVAKLMSASVV